MNNNNESSNNWQSVLQEFGDSSDGMNYAQQQYGAQPQYNNANQQYAQPQYNNANQQYAQPQYNNANQQYAQPQYNNANQQYAQPQYNNANQQYAQPQYNNANQQYAQPQYNNANQQYAQPQYNNANQQYAQPQYNNANQQYAQPQYNNANQQYAQPQYNNANQQYGAQPQYSANQQYGAQSNGQPQYSSQPQYNGQAQPANQPSQPDAQNSYDASSFSVAKPAKSASPLPIILIIVAAAIIVGGLIFAIIAITGNSKSSYESLERGYFSEIGNTVNAVNPVQNKVGGTATITLDFGNALKNEFPTTELDSSVIRIESLADTTTNKGYSNIKLSTGSGVDIISANAWISDDKIFIELPELLNKYFVIDLAALEKMATDGSDLALTTYDIDEYYDQSYDIGYKIGQNIMELDEETLNRVIDAFSDSYFKNFGDAPKTEEEFTVGQITDKYSTYTVNFTQATVSQFAIDFLTACRDDEKIMAFLNDCDVDNATISAAISYVQTALDELTEEEKTESLFTMKVYSDGKEIIGRVLQSYGAKITIAYVEKNGKFEGEFSMISEDGETVAFRSEGNVEGDRHSGKFDITAEGKSVFTGEFDIKSNNKDTCSGTLSATVKDDGSQSTISMSMDITPKKSNISLDVSLDNESLFTLKIDTEETPYKDITLPETNDSNSIDFVNGDMSEEDSQTLMINFQKLLNDKVSNMEKPDIICVMLASMFLNSSMY